MIVAYQGEEYLSDCLTSVSQADFSGMEVHVCLVDNASTDDTCKLVAEQFPWCILLRSEINRGFSGGNNWGWSEIQKRFPSIQFLYLLNQDTMVDPAFLREAVDYFEQNPQVGAAQSFLILHPETDLINTAGNQLHYLGFGLPKNYRDPVSISPDSGIIGYPSGAGVLIRADLLREHGLFSDHLFMYLEDAELGWRLHLLGRPPHLCATSIVYHKYVYSSTLKHYHYLERNRWWLLLTCFRPATLALLLPAIMFMELGQWAFALGNGFLKQKFWSYRSLLSLESLRQLAQARRQMQGLRRRLDSSILSLMIGEFHSPHLRSVLVRYLANPLFQGYFRLVKAIVRW